MSMVPSCVVCDRRLPNPYAPGTHCSRCQQPCQVCGGPIQNCQHPLAEQFTEVRGDPLLKRDAA
jgi:hypothetical protein